MECYCENVEKHLVGLLKDLAEKLYGSQSAFASVLFKGNPKPSQKWYRIYKTGQPIGFETACRACVLLDTNLPDMTKQACRIALNEKNESVEGSSKRKEIRV